MLLQILPTTSDSMNLRRCCSALERCISLNTLFYLHFLAGLKSSRRCSNVGDSNSAALWLSRIYAVLNNTWKCRFCSKAFVYISLRVSKFHGRFLLLACRIHCRYFLLETYVVGEKRYVKNMASSQMKSR